MPTPAVLLAPEFLPLWQRLSTTLDRRGLDHRGWIQLPDGLPDVVYARLGDVLGQRFPTTKRRLDLAALDRALARHGSDVASVLADAGSTPTGRREQRDADRDRVRDRDEAMLAAAVEAFGDEPWVAAWVRDVRSTVPDAAAARRAVQDVRRVLDAAGHPSATSPGVRSRAEIAARALGDAHRLDPGTPDRRRVAAALGLRAGDADRDDAQLWADAGLPPDLVATPVLSWALPLQGEGIAAAVRAMTAAGAPTSLTTLALRDLPVAVPPGTVVLSVENPRLLEAAVQQRLPRPVLCTMGNPTTAVTMLIRALVTAGALVRHHGDFDPAGVAITARLAESCGVEPWRMGQRDYAAALATAAADGVGLRRIDAPVPPAPWDPALQRAMRDAGRAVDQERVMDELLAAHASC